ncbi:MAG: chemotaxis protein CheW [Elusimicrobia bacterium]|nr:chemotaxis protein CheW [Elusimicrobiota bacterium]
MSRGMLIAFSLGSERYGMECRAVAAVLPMARLGPSPGGHPAFAGTLDHHGSALPVVDLERLMTGRPCADHLSTRILVVERAGVRAGLMVERADETCLVDLPAAGTPGLRVFKVLRDERGAAAAAAVPLGRLLDGVLLPRAPGAGPAHGPSDLQ